MKKLTQKSNDLEIILNSLATNLELKIRKSVQAATLDFKHSSFDNRDSVENSDQFKNLVEKEEFSLKLSQKTNKVDTEMNLRMIKILHK